MKKVLIIDDEEKLRTLLARIISLEGFDVLQGGKIEVESEVGTGSVFSILLHKV